LKYIYKEKQIKTKLKTQKQKNKENKNKKAHETPIFWCFTFCLVVFVFVDLLCCSLLFFVFRGVSFFFLYIENKRKKRTYKTK